MTPKIEQIEKFMPTHILERGYHLGTLNSGIMSLAQAYEESGNRGLQAFLDTLERKVSEQEEPNQVLSELIECARNL